MKKILTIFMCMAMFMCFMPSTAFAGTPVAATDVAKIGDIGYETLQAAVDAAEDGETVTLLDNVIQTSEIAVAGKAITIDLNGKTISRSNANEDIFWVHSSGKITLSGSGKIENTKADGTVDASVFYLGSSNSEKQGAELIVGANITLEGASGVIIVGDNAKVDIYGSINSKYYAISGNGEDNCGGVSVNIYDGANLKATDADSTAIYFPNTSELNISGGTMEGATGIYQKSGKMTISGGTIKGTGAQAAYEYYGSGFNNTGDAVVIDKCNYPGGNPTVTISGGIFTSEHANAIGSYFGNGATGPSTGFITGGTFSSDPKAYVSSGYEVKGTAAPYTVSRIYVPSAPSGPVETPDPVVNDKTAETTTAKIEPTTVGGKTTATVDTKTANTIVDKAIENKSSEVVINASSSTPVTPSTTPVESKVELPTAAVKDIVEKTDANIVVKTDAATIELDQTAAQAVADKAGEAEKVNLVVETKAEKEDQVVIELKIETASGNVTDFKGGNVKVTVNIPKALEGKKVVCVYVDENGNYTKMEGKLNNDGTYTFVTGHFSTYVVMTEEEAAAAIEAQKSSKIAAGVQATTLKVRSSAAKGKITVKWTKSKGFKVDYYQVFKATKKNGTFKYLAKTTKLQLVNKKGLKAGKTYYFKVRGVRVVDGAKIYTKWSKLAIRKAK